MKDTKNQGLYNPLYEHDACGIGFVANLKGKKSHKIVSDALSMLTKMEHRGACGCETNTGDGAGILIQVPHDFFKEVVKEEGFEIPAFTEYGVAQIFFPPVEDVTAKCKVLLEETVAKFGFEVLGYRSVVQENHMIGNSAKAVEPNMEQIFVKRPTDMDLETFERKLYVIRNYVTHTAHKEIEDTDLFYVPTFSYKTIGYKGMLSTEQVEMYYPDLRDERVISAIGVVHSRFSTNTFPKWKLAQPFRYIAHNGEINTVRGNVNWFKSKEALFETSKFSQEELDMLFPICDHTQSDSANLDNAVEMMVLGSDRSLPEVMMMLVPEAWQENKEMDATKRAFYEYNSNLMEPWDGPASISFTDGNIVGATLDRNGLRPSRYLVTDDDTLIMASETGVLQVDPATVVKRGRLEPGKIFVADLAQGRIIADDELKADICSQKPYAEWLKENSVDLSDLSGNYSEEDLSDEALLNKQQTFGYTSEDLKVVISDLSKLGVEPLGSMGFDWALPILSDQSQHLSHYFKQLFAQVTNPPIDPIRERMVMSLFTSVGGSKNVLQPAAEHCAKIQLEQPVLTNAELAKLKEISKDGYKSVVIETLFSANGEDGVLEAAIDKICAEAVEATKAGANILILSDKNVDSANAPIPSLLATGAIHHALINAGIRANTSIVVESGDVRETHHVATLVGYGAHAVNPYLAFESIKGIKRSGLIGDDFTTEDLQKNFVKGIGYGLLKIFSKMGISTIQSYHGAQIFEAMGIATSVVNKCFAGTASRIEGLDFNGIAKEVLINHDFAFPKEGESTSSKLEVGGVYQWKRRGEKHLFNPTSIHYLQQSTKTDDYQMYKKYAKEVNDQTQRAATLRGLLDFEDRQPISVAEVEPAENILKRFATGAMSFGSISHEAHSTLAIAMNRIGAKSNSGEGGEDPRRFKKKENGDWERSAIKQIASGRFGVTSYYLTNADELQIKMAQGAKPGEGGQLPGHKVDDWIGATRHSTPGVGLISPPPHHDIYSIEDLAQLIYDLKNANRDARVNVKLVSEVGVGTIASGVSKAHADVILIAGHDGGTGASPLSSIRHAGLPWELGLSEAHQTLVKNRLRSRVVLQADGQMKTGRDIAIAALLGAEEWGVATAALVVEGCIMMRKCHMNTCPVGIATQNKTLRERFSGNPDHVVNFFQFLVQDLREIMAELGFRTVNEMIGRVDKLKVRDEINHWKYKDLDFSKILYKEPSLEGDTLYNSEEQDHALEAVLDRKFIDAAQSALENGQKIQANFNIVNTDRSAGTMVSNEISKRYDGQGLAEDTIHFNIKGSAGQSFGAFTAPGLTMELEGEANDYFGKGLSGAKLILYPHKETKYAPKENIIVGNVAFYGATSGEAYIRGIGGERFCVRNSGAKAVIEGIGDHGCEYMTGGTAVVLGKTGRNFAAGMSGGVAYVYDVDGTFKDRVNKGMIEFDPIEAEDKETLKTLIGNHFNYTNSDVAEEILADFEGALTKFVKVMPTDYKAVLLKRKQEQSEKKEEVHG
ncbi:MAG: glutamate synthase large subunit [Cytophagales bacterium]|nr:glutamate synthase large subunit [Cytophagales bacterium]